MEHAHEFTLVVTYTGRNPEGAPFFGAAVGVRPEQRPTVVPIETGMLAPQTRTTITARMQNAPFQMTLLAIADDTHEGGTTNWIVHDLRINDRTQLVQEGPLPGDLFSTGAIDSFLALEECEPGSTIEIDVSYIGLNKQGARFVAHLEGTVVREDYSVAPTDLHVIVEVASHRSTVVATCDWRPSVDNSLP